MDMMNMTTSSGTTVTLPAMNMMPFHTAVGLDMLWFSTWMPASAAATFGACVGLFFLAIFYRFTIAFLATNAIRLAANETETWAKDLNKLGKQVSSGVAIRYPAFSLQKDLTVGILEGLSSFVGYLLMLAVMIMNAWFFIAILLGIIVGETSFGRFKRCQCVRSHEASLDANECC